MAKIDLNEYLDRLEEPEDRETASNRAYQRELFLEYVVRGDNFKERRTQLLQEFHAGKELTGPKGLRRKLGTFDLEYFGRAYLAHYFVRKSPAFHGELDRIWREGVLKGLKGCVIICVTKTNYRKEMLLNCKESLMKMIYLILLEIILIL